MAQGKFAAKDIKGLTPGVDATQSQELFALDGNNYIFDSLGVKTPFGNRFVTPVQFLSPSHVQGFRLRLRGGDRSFVCCNHGVFEWDESAGGWLTVFWVNSIAATPYRWTYEYLNGYLYIAHPAVGFLVLNLDTNLCYPHAIVGVGTPTDVIALSQNNGRLGVLTSTTMSWSAPSNGLDFVPAFAGPGFQVLAERVAGDASMISSYARGMLTWTTGGIMRSEFTGDAAVFRHRTLNTEYRPINSFCIVRVDEDTCILLDERGLYQSRGESITPYAPLFNEFLIDFLQKNQFRNGTNVRLEWDDRQRRLYVSYSSSYSSPVFEKCFVYYPPLDKWGEFNEPHYGILPILITDSERSDDYFSFVDATGRLRYWKAIGSRQMDPLVAESPRLSNLYVPEIQKPTQHALDDTGQIVSSVGKLRGFDAAGITQVEGYYTQGSGVPVVAELTGLNARVRFGYVRLVGDSAADEVTEILSATVRSVQAGDPDSVTEDFNIVPDGTTDEDYNLLTGGEDLGLEVLNYVNHKFDLIGTLDGVSEFMRETPDMVSFQQAGRYYACSVSGVWIAAEFRAEDVGESFHIRTFELTGTTAGRYM